MTRVADGPLAVTLAAAGAHGVGLGIGVPDAPGWVPAQTLARDPDGLRGALERAGAALGTARADIGATRLCEVWTWNLAAPAAASLLLDGRLPDLRAPNVAVRLAGDPSGWAVALVDGRFHALHTDPEAGHPDARLACSEQALLARLNADLADHLGPLVEQLNALSGRPRAALWRSAADRLAGAFLWLGERLACEPRARARAARWASARR